MHKLTVVLISALLAACQPVTVHHHHEGPVPVSVRVDDAALWLEEWHQLVDFPKNDLERIQKSWESGYARNADPRARVRLALLLATGPVPVRDQPRALRLLEGLDQDKANKSTLALAVLLQQVLKEQLWSVGRIAEIKGKLHQADARVIELEQQLQALTNIEQSIQQREMPVSRKEKK